MDRPQKPHAIVVAYPFQGHVIPAVHLAMKLASKGFTITFVNTQSIDYQISRGQPHAGRDDIFAGARESGLDIRYTTVSDGFPAELDRSLEQIEESQFHLIWGHVDELVGKIVRTADPPVSCLVADTLHLWTPTIAKKYELVNVSFWTEPALVFTLYYHLDLLKSNGHFASNSNRKDTIDYVPGVKAIQPTDLMSYLQEAEDKSMLEHRILNKSFDNVKGADFILYNTVQELEPETISALHQKQPSFAIGPIFPSTFTKSIVATSLWSESDCTQWLDTKPISSVLYVSFGSLARVSKDDIIEIAHGLWLSGVSFIWVLRQDIVSSVETYSLPVGFENGVKDRGLIVAWCSQVAVISHPAVGGFLTHCGWNSILEGIWCTLPLLCFPFFADQTTNRKLVVDDWKIGINLCDEKSITREETTKKINRLMSGRSADELRCEIKKAKKTLENAIGTDGSSERNFNQFLKDLEVKIHKKT